MIVDINPRKINIDHDFKGISLLVYGARNDAGNIVIVVRGPRENQILRRKGRVLGIWTNVENIKLDDFYSYYSVSSMKPLTSVQNDMLLKNLEVGLDNIDISYGDPVSPKKLAKLKRSSIKLMKGKGLYREDDYDISFWGETLFRSFIEFPKNISKGTYDIDVYLFNDGLLHSYQTLPVIVEKVGVEAYVQDMAMQSPALYGVMCVALALVIGWLAAWFFSKRQLS